MGNRRFWGILAAIVLAGVVFRIGYVLTVTRHDHNFYDATYYELEARSIVHQDGAFFTQPYLQFVHQPPIVRASAEHPPGTVLALLPAALIPDAEISALAMRLTMVAAGSITVLLAGLLGRLLAESRAGLAAAAIAALDPNLWMNDGLIMSEALATLGAVGLTYLAYRALRGSAGWRWPAASGLVAGLATLVRSELAVLVPLLVVPAV